MTQKGLFNDEDLILWKKEWKGMPEFIQEDLSSMQSILVHFANKEDRGNFSKLVKQTITAQTKSIWFPKPENIRIGKVYTNES